MPKTFVAPIECADHRLHRPAEAAAVAQAIGFGHMLFVSGQGPLDPVTRTVVGGDIEVQTRRTLDNLLSVLEAGGDAWVGICDKSKIGLMDNDPWRK